MKKLALISVLSMLSMIMEAQMSKLEVETAIKSVNLQDIKDIYLIRTREHDGTTQGWFEKFEKLDPKTIKISYSENSMILDGNSYTALIPYDKIKLIFTKKTSYLSIELID